MSKRKISIAAAVLAAGSFFAAGAQAANVQWSIGINLPPVATVISSAPVLQPVYYPPAPVHVQPAPVVVYRPAPVIVRAVPRYIVPAPVVRAGWVVPRASHRDRHHHHHHHHDEYGDSRRGDRWVGPPHRR